MTTTETIDDALSSFLQADKRAPPFSRQDAATISINALSSGDWDSAARDVVLDHLAQGQAFAQHGVTAMYAQHAREVSDVTDPFAEMGSESFRRGGPLSATDRFRRERYRGAVYIPKMKTDTKIMVTTVLILMAVFAMMSGLAAYAITYLTSSIRVAYTDTAPSIEQQPVSNAVLLSDTLYNQLLEKSPEQIVSLSLKRARVQHQKELFAASIESFKTAELHSVHPIPFADHLDHVQCLIGAGRIEGAMGHLSELDFGAMTAEEQGRATALLGRLHFAVP